MYRHIVKYMDTLSLRTSVQQRLNRSRHHHHDYRRSKNLLPVLTVFCSASSAQPVGDIPHIYMMVFVPTIFLNCSCCLLVCHNSVTVKYLAVKRRVPHWSSITNCFSPKTGPISYVGGWRQTASTLSRGRIFTFQGGN